MVLIAEARRQLRAKARWACGGVQGRGKLDPVYIEVTQGRDTRAMWEHYSSCGDLLHWLAWESGIQAPWVNRAPHWRIAENISVLHGALGPAIETPVGYVPEAGDFLLCWHADGTHAHACVAGDAHDGHVETFNYGAGGMQPTEHPGATFALMRLHALDGVLELVNPRSYARTIVQRVVPAYTLVMAAGDAWPAFCDAAWVVS